MVSSSLLESLVAWAQNEPDIAVLTLFGSQARGIADSSSDVDLQIVTRKPERFFSEEWTTALQGQVLHAYVVRPATGGVQKVTALFASGEVDLVIVPLSRLQWSRRLVRLGLHRKIGPLRALLSNLSVVFRPGYKVLKGGRAWELFYSRVVGDVPDPRLRDSEVLALATGAYLDAVWVIRKAARGELLAAQRWLHKTPVEVNFRLLNEWRARRGQPMCFDARRAEMTLPPDELKLIAIAAELEPAALVAAARRSVASTRYLVKELTGKTPTWPDI